MSSSTSIQFTILNIIVATTTCTTWHRDCDLNDELCFINADKYDWKLNYVSSKQDYIDHISEGESGLTNIYREKKQLPRIDGFQIGHTDKITLQDDRTVDIITKSLKPLLFEIPNFLTDDECEHIIKRAQDPKEGGMVASIAKGGLTPLDSFKRTNKRGKADGKFGQFKYWDLNLDRVISFREMTEFIHSQRFIVMVERDIRDMFTVLGLDELLLRDGVVDAGEFQQLDTIGMEEHIGTIFRENPRFRRRESNQAWLFMEKEADPTVHHIRERLVKITGLPRELIYGGEQMQVVRYETGGHFHAHHDTETHKGRDILCCHQNTLYTANSSVGKCKLCRYLTFMIYLNDVEEGGETAFPIADGYPDITHETITDALRGNSTTDRLNLSHGCHRANLRIQPEKGKAVMWYNHFVNTTDGWLGKIDVHSIHGGCDVIKGEKWIANIWIDAPYGNFKQDPSIYLNWNDLYFAEQNARH